MGWLNRFFNWRGAVEVVVAGAIDEAAAKVKEEISASGNWTKTQQVHLKEGVDLLADAAIREVKERL